jgi:hypothetical protein
VVVLRRVLFACLIGVMAGVQRVPMRDVRVVAGLEMVLVLVVFGRLSMVLCRLFVVLRGLPMMLCSFVFRHMRLRRAPRANLRRIRTDDPLVAAVGALTFEAAACLRQTRFGHEPAVVA